MQLLGVAKIDEHRAHAGAVPAVDVTPAIPDHPGTRQVEPEVTRVVEQHAGLGLAPRIRRRALAARRVADLDSRDFGDELEQPGMHHLDGGL